MEGRKKTPVWKGAATRGFYGNANDEMRAALRSRLAARRNTLEM